MKVRNGFVSNSSSSSFIVIFPRAPTSAEDLHELLFGKEHVLFDSYDGDDGDVCSHILVRSIWDEIQEQETQTEQSATRLTEELASVHSYIDFYARPITSTRETYFTDRVKYYNDILTSVQKTLTDPKGQKIYVFDYDDSGTMAFLESGEQFEHAESKVKAFRISHH